jgi:hypothetical protein
VAVGVGAIIGVVFVEVGVVKQVCIPCYLMKIRDGEWGEA